MMKQLLVLLALAGGLISGAQGQGTYPGSLSIGGCSNLAAPTQTTPIFAQVAPCGVYADSGSGNIFNLSSWIDNAGTRPAVAVFGQGRGTGTNSLAWGGNFVAYANGTGSFAQGVEVDFGVANGVTANATGLSINAGGTSGSNTVTGLNFDSISGGSGNTMVNAIRFNNFGRAQPYTNALIVTGNAGGALTVPLGIDFSNASFGTAAIQTKGFFVNPTGAVLSGGAGVANGSFVLAGTTSGTVTLSTNATGSLLTISQPTTVTGGLSTNSTLSSGTTTVSSLPACNSGLKGARHFVTDLNQAVSYHATVTTGGGATNLGVTCDGTNWYMD